MSTRRDFLKSTAIGIGAAAIPQTLFTKSIRSGEIKKPIVISTWNHGLAANEAAWKVLTSNGSALDAVESGVRVTEDDPEITSVGYGGLPDETGKVTLDACIMDWDGHCGAVGCVQNYKNPISIARKVMERTNHIFLVGEGAEQFAKAMGFQEMNLLTEKSRQAWLEWKANANKQTNWKSKANALTHDTIGMIALDNKGRLSGACTTSGLAFKIHGRVGDSPIIGAGMYCDGEVGAAAATGVGEAVIRVCGSFLVVENMRRGASPQEACEDAIKRVIHFNPDNPQVAFIALNKNGDIGAYSNQKNFQYALYRDGKNELIDSKYEVK